MSGTQLALSEKAAHQKNLVSICNIQCQEQPDAHFHF